MNPSRLHQLWSVIESTQAHILTTLSDRDLIQCLLDKLDEREALDSEGTTLVRNYIRDRVSLIRDLAYHRLATP